MVQMPVESIVFIKGLNLKLSRKFTFQLLNEMEQTNKIKWNLYFGVYNLWHKIHKMCVVRKN